MPVGMPPLGGPVGRSRMRLSASGLVSWERCSRQWFHRTKQGLSGPVNPEMILGIIVEDALVSLLMEDPGDRALDAKPCWIEWQEDGEKSNDESGEEPESLQDLEQYLLARIPACAAKVIQLGAKKWKDAPFKSPERDWSEKTQDYVEALLQAGIELQLEEVE